MAVKHGATGVGSTGRRLGWVAAGVALAAWCLLAAAPAASAGGLQRETGPPEMASTTGGASAASQPLISNVFVETFITQALQDIGMQAGVNILVEPGVQGFVTLELQDVPLERALRMVLAGGGYGFVRLDDRTYLVGRGDRESPNFHVLTQTRPVRFSYVKAEQARRLMPEYYAPYVRFDAETNTALVTAPPELLARIVADLQMVDRQAPQVVIEAIVTEVSEDARRQLGLDWEWTSRSTPPDIVAYNPMEGVLSAVVGTPFGKLMADLKLLVDQGKASIRANPRITVVNGASASIFVGQDRYIKIETESGSTTFTRLEAINAGVSLNITPWVAESGEVTLTVKPTVTDVTEQMSDGLPVVSRREVSTTVRVPSGQTLALGGLVQESREDVTASVPVLGDLPVLRHLFWSSRTQQSRSEVIVLITPHVLPPATQAAPARP